MGQPAFVICTYVKQCAKKYHDQERSLRVGSDIQFIAFDDSPRYSKEEIELREKLEAIRAEEDKIRKEKQGVFKMNAFDKAKVDKIVAAKMKREELEKKAVLEKKLEQIEKERIRKEKAMITS